MTAEWAIFWGVAGSILTEAVKQRQKWVTLSEEKFRAQFVSLKFWSTVMFLSACGGAAAWFLFEKSGSGELKSLEYAMAGGGAQALLRTFAGSAVASRKSSAGFGPTNNRRLTFRDILS